MANDNNKATHLQIIQDVIERMAHNSLELKKLSVTLSTAAVAYMGTVPSAAKLVGVAASIAVIIMWVLDARYLRLERLYRALYDGVRAKEETDFSMNVNLLDNEIPGMPKTVWSWSVVWVYIILIAVLLIVAFGPAAKPKQSSSLNPMFIAQTSG